LEFKLQHTYTQEGNFNINLIVKSHLKKGALASNPLVIPVQIQVKPPTIEFSHQAVTENIQRFFIKAKKESFPIKSWQIDFGDGAKEQGEGEVEKSIVHAYLEKGPYQAVFSVITEDNKAYTQKLSFKIHQDAPEGMTIPVFDKELSPVSEIGPKTLLSQETSQPQTQKQEQPDLAIEKLELPSDVYLGEKTIVSVKVKNNSSSQIDNIPVNLETDDGFKETKEITLKPQMSQTLEFLWFPQKLGKQKITATLDYKDTNQRNNRLIQNLEVKQKETKPSEEKKEEKTPIDLSLERIETKSEIFIGEKTELSIHIKNNSKEIIKDCSVILETEDGLRDRRTISLGQNKLEKVNFSWIPKQTG
ncbi:MAG: hypothetical protein N2Z79_01930, partial [Candidatus Omnitrophica bacterium]|nr:hypothetical protein [Candidatus Omnitrophota bacterium]